MPFIPRGSRSRILARILFSLRFVRANGCRAIRRTDFSRRIGRKKMSGTRRIVSAVVLLICFADPVFAQGGATGAINGTVQDASGAVLAGARVDIINEGTGQTVRQLTTDPAGIFTAPLLPVATYSVEVSASGFAKTKFPGIAVRITETTRLTATLKPT